MSKKMIRCIVLLITLFLIISLGVTMINYKTKFPEGIKPKSGCVPDEETAIKIAEAVWLPIYGEEIYDVMPFVATYNLIHGYWHVRGTLPDDRLGGVPEIKVKKSDGQIVYLFHYK